MYPHQVLGTSESRAPTCGAGAAGQLLRGIRFAFTWFRFMLRQMTAGLDLKIHFLSPLATFFVYLCDFFLQGFAC